MPEGTVIQYGPEDYPELEGVEDGRKVKFSGEAVIENLGGESKGLRVLSMKFETENQADRELKNLKGPSESYADASEAEVEL